MGNKECERSSGVQKLQSRSNITLKQACETEKISELPSWFAKSKDVRLRICFPNAYDPKYLMARRRLFKQMQILKEEHALKNKGTSAVIKLTPCAPPSFAKNSKHLKFKPIKGHVVKPTQSTSIISSSISDHSTTVTVETDLQEQKEKYNVEPVESTNVEKESVNISNDKIDSADVTKSNKPHQNELNINDKNIMEKEGQSNSSDSQEEERPRRRTRRR